MAPDSPIEGHEAMDPWGYPRATGCHRWTSVAIGAMHAPG